MKLNAGDVRDSDADKLARFGVTGFVCLDFDREIATVFVVYGQDGTSSELAGEAGNYINTVKAKACKS